MANTIFSSEGALLFIMVATVALGFWLLALAGAKRWARP